MTDLDAIRARHRPQDVYWEGGMFKHTECAACGQLWSADQGCDTARETARADKAEAERDQWKAELLELALVRERQRDATLARADKAEAALVSAQELGLSRTMAEDRSPSGEGCVEGCPAALALAKWEASRAK